MLPPATAGAAGGLPADSTRDESRSQTLAGSKVVSRQHPQSTPNQVPGGRSVRRQCYLTDGARVPGPTYSKRAGCARLPPLSGTDISQAVGYPSLGNGLRERPAHPPQFLRTSQRTEATRHIRNLPHTAGWAPTGGLHRQGFFAFCIKPIIGVCECVPQTFGHQYHLW